MIFKLEIANLGAPDPAVQANMYLLWFLAFSETLTSLQNKLSWEERYKY